MKRYLEAISIGYLTKYFRNESVINVVGTLGTRVGANPQVALATDLFSIQALRLKINR